MYPPDGPQNRSAHFQSRLADRADYSKGTVLTDTSKKNPYFGVKVRNVHDCQSTNTSENDRTQQPRRGKPGHSIWQKKHRLFKYEQISKLRNETWTTDKLRAAPGAEPTSCM